MRMNEESIENDLESVLPFLPTPLEGKSVLFVDYENDDKTLKVFLNENVANLLVLHLNSASHDATVNKTPNLDHLHANLANFDLGDKKFDYIFVNSTVLANLRSDADVQTLADKALHYLTEAGYLLFRDAKHSSNREPIAYIDLVESRLLDATTTDGRIGKLGYTLIFVKSRDFRTALVSFLFQKTALNDFHGFKTLREFMDHKQYSRKGVLTYEKIFGDGFVSTGGLTTTERFFEQYIKPTAGQRMLDVGCGIGGGDFYASEKYGAEVFGMDLSSNMVSIAWERLPQHKNAKVHFEIGDITKQRFPDESFDIIYSRDTILHIPNKELLFAQFKKWLKPGGKVFITDYCCGPRANWSAEFKTYVESRGYDLREVPDYGKIFADLGFRNVQAVDVTGQFVDSLNAELVKMNEIKETFVKEFSQQDFDYLVDGWNAKLVRCANGNQVWGLFYCEK